MKSIPISVREDGLYLDLDRLLRDPARSGAEDPASTGWPLVSEDMEPAPVYTGWPATRPGCDGIFGGVMGDEASSLFKGSEEQVPGFDEQLLLDRLGAILVRLGVTNFHLHGDDLVTMSARDLLSALDSEERFYDLPVPDFSQIAGVADAVEPESDLASFDDESNSNPRIPGS